MKKQKLLLLFIVLLTHPILTFGQTFWRVGNANDVTTTPQAGVYLAGGGGDNDQGMSWFLERANGGDIVVIRASGDDAYNNYLLNQLGVAVNSVTTILIPSSAAANQTSVETAIRNAEALFIAGGDQWDYINFWKGTKVFESIDWLVNTKGVTVGGTSAGLAILGEVVFTAQNNTVFSSEALGNPYHFRVTLDNNVLNIPLLNNIVADPHMNRIETDGNDRKGRLTVFMARMVKDWSMNAKGIGISEYVGVGVSPDGLARVFGNPAFDDHAYFLDSQGNIPETCVAGTPLTWNNNQQAVKVFKILGTPSGNRTFNILNWGTDLVCGEWQYWYVQNGTLNIVTDEIIECQGGGGSVAELPFYEPFLGLPTENGWTLIDADGDGRNWYWDSFGAESYMLSASYASGQALTPDNWLITPPIDATNASTLALNYKICPTANTPAYRTEHYSVLISTTNTELSSFTTVFSETLLSTMTNWVWVDRLLDISAYSGETIYIAFRHHNSTDKDRIALLEVAIAEVFTITASAGENGSISPSGNISVLGGLNRTFLFIPAAGYDINEVFVDGISIGYAKSYTFQNVNANHTIHVTFKPCIKVEFLPFSEDFNASTNIPPCWSMSRPVGTVDWQFGTYDNGLSGTGIYAYANGNANNNNKQMNLFTPAFDFTNYTNVNLSFTHRYRHRSNCSANVAYSIDGGNNWTILQSWTSDSQNPATFSQVIIALDNQPNVKFRWQYLQTGSNTQTNRNWSVDNVMITGEPVPVIPEITFANLQGPAYGEIEPGESFEVFGRVFIEDITGQQEATEDLLAWLGYNSEDTDPSTWNNWIAMQYFAQAGNNDEFVADLGVVLTEEGTYYYATRFRYLDQDFVYGGYSGTGGGFWNGTTNVSGSVVVASGPYVPPTIREVVNEVISNGVTICYDATETIFVSDFLAGSGSIVTFVAGQNIVFQDGTVFEDGSFVWAYITLSNEYCTQPASLLSEPETAQPVIANLPVPEKKSIFSVHPNPSSGQFNLKLSETGITSRVAVEIFSIYGEKIAGFVLPEKQEYLVDLSTKPNGIYIVRVHNGMESGVERIIKQ